VKGHALAYGPSAIENTLWHPRTSADDDLWSVLNARQDNLCYRGFTLHCPALVAPAILLLAVNRTAADAPRSAGKLHEMAAGKNMRMDSTHAQHRRTA
jgi:hypothetical protein